MKISPSTMMRGRIAPVDDRITKCFVRIVYANLGPETPSCTFGAARSHFLETLQIFFNRIVAMLGRDSICSFLAHLLHASVIRITFACFQELNCVIVKLVKVVGSVRQDVRLDLEQLKVLEDGLLKLGLWSTV
jgi:hypothetical protein